MTPLIGVDWDQVRGEDEWWWWWWLVHGERGYSNKIILVKFILHLKFDYPFPGFHAHLGRHPAINEILDRHRQAILTSTPLRYGIGAEH